MIRYLLVIVKAPNFYTLTHYIRKKGVIAFLFAKVMNALKI